MDRLGVRPRRDRRRSRGAGRGVVRVALMQAEAAEALAWARALASRIAAALATPDDPAAFPPRPSTACNTCRWVNQCLAGRAALEAMDESAIHDNPEARRLAGLLFAGEARVGRLRERLKQYLQDREPLAVNGIELGFFPTKGRYDAATVFRAATAAGVDPWPLLAADGRTLAAFLKRRPNVEQTLAGAWTPSAAWFGHRKAKMAGVAAVQCGRHSDDSGTAPETFACAGRDDIPSRTDRTSADPPPQEDVMTVHTRQEDPKRQFTERRREWLDLEPAILIIGSCRREAFAPAEVLICADTLEGEQAVRLWLAEHKIHLTSCGREPEQRAVPRSGRP
jgi:hypothetical protein